MKKSKIPYRLTALIAALLMIVFSVSCAKDKKEEVVSVSDVNSAEKGVYHDTGETFCRGVWAADDGEKLLGYYVFLESGSGRFDEIQMGLGVPFEVTAKDDKAEFNLGAVDFAEPARVEKTGKGKRTLTWTNDKRTEYLTLLEEQEPDTFTFYSQKDIEEMALDHYEANKGKRPKSAEVSVAADGMASVVLYGKKNKVLTQYVVNVITGDGIVEGSDEETQLIGMSTDD